MIVLPQTTQVIRAQQNFKMSLELSNSHQSKNGIALIMEHIYSIDFKTILNLKGRLNQRRTANGIVP